MEKTKNTVSKIKHTDIPWNCIEQDNGCAIKGSDAVGNVSIAWCSEAFTWSVSGTTYSVNKEEALANAAFIVRACNNYNAIRTSLENLVSSAKSGILTKDDKTIVEADNLLKALAKED